MNMQKFFNHVILIPIYIVEIYTWLMAGGEKILGPVPENFSKAFGGTFLSVFPGLTITYYQIAIMEIFTALLFMASLMRCEFFNGQPRPLLNWGMWLATLNFAMLGFGMRLVGNYQGAADLFFYLGANLVIWIFIIYQGSSLPLKSKN